MSERDHAIRLAHVILDQPSRDPDDDISTMSRQFLRQLDRSNELRDVLVKIRGWREIGSADTPSEKLRAIEEICDAALEKTT